MTEGLCCRCGHGLSLPRHGTDLPIRWCDLFKEDKIGVLECDRKVGTAGNHVVLCGFAVPIADIIEVMR